MLFMPSEHPKILVADDDISLVKALSIRLWDLGFEMITATDSNQIVNLALQSKPDVVVLDVNMPAGDGFSVHEHLKQVNPLRDTPVIYLTGDRSSRLDMLAKEIGAVALFHKPFQLKELVATIDQAINNKAPAV